MIEKVDDHFVWTDELKQQIAELSVNHSAREIALILSGIHGTRVSKNTIIGLRQRLGLKAGPQVKSGPPKQRRPSPTRLVRANGNSDAMLLSEVAPTQRYEPRAIEIASRNIPLLDLAFGNCRYITQDSPQTLYCGLPIHQRSYCAAHFALCYETVQSRRSKRAKDEGREAA